MVRETKEHAKIACREAVWTLPVGAGRAGEWRAMRGARRRGKIRAMPCKRTMDLFYMGFVFNIGC
eukprot:326275-Pyramimonas_sp.AAC.1